MLRPVLLAVAVVLAGCAQKTPPPASDGGGEPPLGACTLAVDGLRAHIAPGEGFAFEVTPECPYPWTSDDVGATFAPAEDGASTACSSSADAWNATEHPETRCTIDAPGTYVVRGRARIGQDVDLESPGYVVVVREDPLTPLPGSVRVWLEDVPAAPEAGEAFDVDVVVEWAIPPPGVPANATARWGEASSANATEDAYPEACPTVAGAAPGMFRVTCTIEADAHGRGLVRLPVGGVLEDHWSEEVPVRAV